MSRAVAGQCSPSFVPSRAARIDQKRAETRSALMTADDAFVAARLLGRAAFSKSKLFGLYPPFSRIDSKAILGNVAIISENMQKSKNEGIWGFEQRKTRSFCCADQSVARKT